MLVGLLAGARSRLRTLSVLIACEYRGGLTHQRFQPRAFWRAPAVTPRKKATGRAYIVHGPRSRKSRAGAGANNSAL